jgi:poly(ADP-ribose) glycohydrolase ARH3
MPSTSPNQQTITLDKYKGCFLGLALGDALGAPYEGGPLERLLWKAIGKTRDGKLRYTDDTQMAIDLAESFLHNNTINQDHLAHTFANSYQWSRGYGPSTSQLLKLIKKGKNWKEANKKKFKTGSFGNGAAMRAPILAMCFPADTQALLDSVIRSAEITHAHPLGIEGARLIALATQAAFQDSDNEKILAELLHQCQSKIYKDKIIFCAEIASKPDIKLREIKRQLGNGIAAPQSCVTAIYFSLKFRDQEFDSMLDKIIRLGGDTDTIASMAGSIWGAFNGSQSLNQQAKNIEKWEKIDQISKDLFEKVHPQRSQTL